MVLEAEEADALRLAELVVTDEAQRLFVAFDSASLMISSVPNSLRRNCGEGWRKEEEVNMHPTAANRVSKEQ